MAHIVKIKPKKNYEWEQDQKYVYVKVSMPGHTSMKNIQVFLSDVMLRITSKQKKSSKVLDLAHEISYLSPENKFMMVDGVINVTLKKQQFGLNWENLTIEGVSMQEIEARRKQSQTRYQQNTKQLEQNKEKLRIQHERMATRNIMAFEEEQRKILERKKKEEMEEGINQVFRNNDERTGKFKKQAEQKKSIEPAVQPKTVERNREKWEEKGTKALQLLEKQEQEERRLREGERKTKKKEALVSEIEEEPTIKKPQNSMFSEEDINRYEALRTKVEDEIEIEEIPVRKQAKVNVNFSSKPYPTVAARDYHFDEPPMPKRSPLFPPTHGDLENKNPLWLKDKGDRLIGDKNYSAAIDAYSEALKIDPSQTKILMNRSLAYLKTLNLNSCIHDCESIELLMQKQLTGSQQNSQDALLNIIKIKTRKAMCLAWKGNLNASKKLFTEILEFDLSPQIKSQIQGCLNSIDKRQQSHRMKLKGDQQVKNQKYSTAINHYNSSIQIDSNEYSLSNKSLCLNKLERYDESTETVEKGLEIMNNFSVNSYGKGMPETGNLYMKMLYRKAKALEGQNNIKEAETYFRKGIEFNPQDKDFKEALKVIKSKQSAVKVASLKIEASNLIKQNRSKQALEIYSNCLKMLESSQSTSEYLSILQNQCVCYLKLGQFDSIISISNRILKLVNNLKNRLVDFDRRKGNISEDQLNKIMVRTLVRRANAYLKTGRRQNAKSDLQKAAQLDPNDPNITKELTKIKQLAAF